jgi:hypothetical protein
MRFVGLVIIALVVIVGLSGCLGGASDSAPVDTSPYHWNESPSQTPSSVPIAYCRAKIVDKCKGLDGANDRFFLSDGSQVAVSIGDNGVYSYIPHNFYNKATIGQEYILGTQDGVVIRMYTLAEAHDSCELRMYIDGAGCGK